MKTMTEKNTATRIIDALNWPYATKKFDVGRKVSAEDMDTLMEAVCLSASSMGLQPYRFLRITDPDVRRQLREVSFDQPQITDASELIVFTAKPEYTGADIDEFLEESQKRRGFDDDQIAKRKKSIEKHVAGFKGEELLNWTSRQLYIAIGQLLTTAAMMEIDACPMEGIKNDEYSRLLKLDQRGLKAFAVVTLGYRSDEDSLAEEAKIRLPREVLFEEI
jgi:nitroreductase